MKGSIITTLLLLSIASCLPQPDLVSPPGMENQTIYSGYLNTDVPNRQIHYVFVAARNNPDTAPLTIWFNGGPGCSSLIGMLQEIGPYIVGNSYKAEDKLTRNQYSWNQASNLLFLESPAIVGFSTDKDYEYHYTDDQTADDAFKAIKNFLQVKAPEFKSRDIFLTGESYAGKYVPDVAVRILVNNQGDISNYISLKGLLVGNGVMNFKNNSLDISEIQYMYEHDFVDDRLWSIYLDSCTKDFGAPRCQYFQYEMELDQERVNPYNVYEVCKHVRSAQSSRMLEAVSKFRKLGKNKNQPLNFEMMQPTQDTKESGEQVKEIGECPSDLGAISYWNTNKEAYHVNQIGKAWSPCTNLNYLISEEGSMKQYSQIFLNKAVRVWLFSGDWDDVVPYRDTEKNLEALKVGQIGEWESWFSGVHHAGFYQNYDSLTLITVKGASHMVPQTKPKESYQMFYNFINNKPINTPV